MLCSFPMKVPILKAAAVVNKLMSLYVREQLTEQSGWEAVAAGDFIAMQLPKTEATVRQAEVALQFKEQNQVVALDEAKSAVAVIKQLENEINETEAELADVTARQCSRTKWLWIHKRA